MAIKFITRKLLVIQIILITLLLSACSYNSLDSVDPTTSFSLQGGILATLKEGNQEFRVWVTRPDTIQQFLNLRQGDSHIIYGRILAGPGIDNYNAPYNWHLDSQDTQIRNSLNKTCNTKLSDLETNVNYYIKDVKYICSQGAVLVKIEDYRIPVPHILTADANLISKPVQEN